MRFNARYLRTIYILVLGFCIGVSISWIYAFNRTDAIINIGNASTRQLLLFVGGHPRSGTTLMRVMLDVHPHVRCGPETRILPMILQIKHRTLKPGETHRLDAANLPTNVIDDATRAFIYTLLMESGEQAHIVCNKDPFALKEIEYLATLFPQAKFINMIRDGRAVVASLLKRNVSIKGYLKEPKDMFQKWEKSTQSFIKGCEQVGYHRCRSVMYEHLVLYPERVMRDILNYFQRTKRTASPRDLTQSPRTKINRTERMSNRMKRSPVSLGASSGMICSSRHLYIITIALIVLGILSEIPHHP